MHYLSSVYSVTIPLQVSGLLVAHHQEVTMYICNKWYVHQVGFITRIYRDARSTKLKIILYGLNVLQMASNVTRARSLHTLATKSFKLDFEGLFPAGDFNILVFVSIR
jgi:hypothetical protein